MRADPQRESSAFDPAQHTLSHVHIKTQCYDVKLKNFVLSYTKTQDDQRNESTAVKALKGTARPERKALSSNVVKEGNGATLLHLLSTPYANEQMRFEIMAKKNIAGLVFFF